MASLFRLIVCCFIFANSACTAQENRSERLSDLVHYQYLIETNTKFDLTIETFKIRYNSDGYEITGYINKPKAEGTWPVTIYNRGGNRDYGTHRNFLYQQYLASNGYVVLSTQLRGNLFSEGQDQFGGEDLNDILKLIEIAHDLSCTKDQKIGVYGISRGGLNAYQISRLTNDISAVVVVGAPVDPRIDFQFRPEMYFKVLKPLVGDTVTHKEAYDYRSPILWADEINEPVLILHGDDDDKVRLINAQLMINKLTELNKDFEFEIVGGGDHGLNTHREIRNKKVLGWFDRHLK